MLIVMKRVVFLLLLFMCAVLQAAYVAPLADTVHFAGGVGDMTGSADTNAGGADETIFVGGGSDAAVFMGTNGDPLDTATGAVVSNNGGKVRLTSATDFSNTIVGVLVRCDTFSGSYDDGVYRVTATDGSDYIDLGDLTYIDAQTVNCVVGGAYDNSVAGLQAMLDDDSTDASTYNRTMYLNSNATINSVTDAIAITVAVDFDEGGGNHSTNVWKKLIGCNTSFVPFTYGNYVSLSRFGDATADVMLDVSFGVVCDNVWIENIGCIDSDAGGGPHAGDDGFRIAAGTTDGFVFKNCWTRNVIRGIMSDSSSDGVTLLHCNFSSAGFTIDLAGEGNGIINTYATTTDGSSWCAQAGQGGSCVVGCVFEGGSYGLETSSGQGTPVFVIGNTFYNQTVAAFDSKNDAQSRLINLYNIILVNTAAADFVYGDSTATYTQGNYWDEYCITNSSTALHNLYGAGSEKALSATQIGLRNAGGGDFRLTVPSKAWNFGRSIFGSSVIDGYRTVGAWQPYVSTPYSSLSGIQNIATPYRKRGD